MEQTNNKTIVYTNILKRFFSDSSFQNVQVFLIIYDNYILLKQVYLSGDEKLNNILPSKEYITKCINSSYGYFEENDKNSLYLDDIYIVKYQKISKKFGLGFKLYHDNLLCVVERDENDNIIFTLEKFIEDNAYNVESSDKYYFFKDKLMKVEVNNISLPISFFTDTERKSYLISEIIEKAKHRLSFEEIFYILHMLFSDFFECGIYLVDYEKYYNSLQIDKLFFEYLQKSGIIIIYNNSYSYLTNKGKYYLSKYINIKKQTI